MASFTSSSVPDNPTLRSHVVNTVIVIPLLSNSNFNSDGTHYSNESFKALFSSLSDINLERDDAPRKKTLSSNEVTLIIPNANLTPPGDWRYDDTPLKSHDWSLGCQRLQFVDGDRSLQALDRLKAFCSTNDQTRSSQYGEFVDLYPSRGTAAVIGVLNVKDCCSLEDLHRAEDELDVWVQKYTPVLYAQKYWEEAFDSPMAPKYFIEKRLFVFDSFEEGNNIDLTLTRLKPGELIAFPPISNMDLHLNVVINDLAVSIFVNLERKIKVLDKLRSEVNESMKVNNEKNSSSSRIEDIADIVGPNSNLNELSLDEDDIELLVGTGNKVIETTSDNDGMTTKEVGKSARPRLRGLAANAVKALNKGNTDHVQDIFASLPPIEHELQTPIDTSFDEDILTSRDIEIIFKRNAARREKHAADFALLAGSVMDAYDRYTKAAEASKLAHDPLWYAAALEGLATTFVAMADTGGHGVDMYLENNFQYPDEVMMAALSVIRQTEDGKETIKLDKSKTTLPRAIYALLEEAADIYSRNIKLASIYSELLLKMAWYSAELENLHNLCRWGDGFSGVENTDDYNMIASVNGMQKRWELTSIHKIDLDAIRKRGKLDGNICFNSASQCQRFVSFLHQASANGGLDALTRAFVADRCVKLCLKGVRWLHYSSPNNYVTKRETLPRKAGFFALIAAESMSQCITTGSSSDAAKFWIEASQIYVKDGNKFDGNAYYAWACLRATVLHGLSLYCDEDISEKALEELLVLLGECAPKVPSRSAALLGKGDEEKSKGQNEFSGRKNIVTSAKPSNHLRGKSGSFPQRSSFSSQTLSQAMMEQAKWVDDEQVPIILLPFIEPFSKVAVLKAETGDIKFLKKVAKKYNALSPLIFLSCAIPDMTFGDCLSGQKMCIDKLSDIRGAMSTTSPGSENTSDVIISDNISFETLPVTNSLPISINTAIIVEPEPHLQLDKVTVVASKNKVDCPLATFFNPYGSKKNDLSERHSTNLISQGEERKILVEFRNLLAIPLEVNYCQLIFSERIDIEASPLSFIVPPRAVNYVVEFPFSLASLNTKNANECVQRISHNDTSQDEPIFTSDHNTSQTFQKAPSFTFEVIGLKIFIFGKLVTIPFETKSAEETNNSIRHQVPGALSTYASSFGKVITSDSKRSIKLEAVSAQPNLIISNSLEHLDISTILPVRISDGETVTIPAFRLENDLGSSGSGFLERLQIVCLGLPSSPKQILFDSYDRKKINVRKGDKGDVNKGMMENKEHPPLKINFVADGLSLSNLNDKKFKSLGTGVTVSFQLIAATDMGERIKSDSVVVKIRFCYRGSSLTPGIEIWRKREISLKIIKMKGPRISQLSIRPDLAWGSIYSDLCHALIFQRGSERRNHDSIKENSAAEEWEQTQTGSISPRKSQDDFEKGRDMQITTDKVVVLVTVCNEGKSSILLSNRTSSKTDFEQESVSLLEVSPDVSVKIPITIPRISRSKEPTAVADMFHELLSIATFNWESDMVGDNDENHVSFFQGKRQGLIRIPSHCLSEIIENHDSFATRLYQPPLSIKFYVNGAIPEAAPLGVQVGLPIELTVETMSEEILKNCPITIEFCCARKSSGISPEFSMQRNRDTFIWCGQSRCSFNNALGDLSHRSKLCFITPGEFVVSACVRIHDAQNRQVWWAPNYQLIQVHNIP